MNIFNDYFNALTFKHTGEKQNYVIYGAAIHSMIGADMCRYILAFVPKNLATAKTAKLRELPWVNLQARLCPKNTFDIRQQSWRAPESAEAMNIMLNIKDRSDKHSIYTCSLPFEVILLHSPKKKTIFQYPNNINLHWAIDQFQTIFNYIKPQTYNNIPNNNFPNNNTEYLPITNPLQTWFQNVQNNVDEYSSSNVELIQ
jgi:hypothetical protein